MPERAMRLEDDHEQPTSGGCTLDASVPSAFSRHTECAVLAVLSGPDQGRMWTVAPREFYLGSGPHNDIRLQDGMVSRRHLRARWTGCFLELEDLGSKNGSYTGQIRFASVQIGLGGCFRVGGTVLKLLPQEVPLEPATPSPGGTSFVGSAPAMCKLHSLMAQVADSHASVLILGETGTGKEVIAEELHRRSSRGGGPFVVLDCGSVPRELVESVLFGHVRGAFTGAMSDQKGLFAQADGGTIFLDEIGELSLELQPALLRAVDRGMIRPVGTTEYQRVDVRILAATHRNLREMILARRFREDLFYRLSVVCLTAPPLRERTEDIDQLTRHFLDAMGRTDVTLTAAALRSLRAHSWPGNVRELRNVIESALAHLGGNSEIDRAHLASLLVADPAPASQATAALHGHAPAPRSGPAAGDIPVHCAPGPAGSPEDDLLPYRDAKAQLVEMFERDYVARLLAQHGSLTAAARAAGMDRKHLRYLLHRYQLR